MAASTGPKILREPGAGVDVGEDGRADEQPVAELRTGRGCAASDQPGAFGPTNLDVAAHLVELRLVDDRAGLGRLVVGHSGAHLLDGVGEQVQEVTVDAAVDQQPGRRPA